MMLLLLTGWWRVVGVKAATDDLQFMAKLPHIDQTLFRSR